ncbi:MAG: hypothetical protein H6731_05690 [Myxococcales bacterium]|nr:MAG: hypothetical protein H6731_05690 [Myxococcales bacterium]
MLEHENQPKVGKIEYNPQYITIRNGDQILKLAYGEIIALAGDFVGMSDKTISDGVEIKHFEKMRSRLEDNFRRAFEALLPSEQNPIYSNNNLDYLRGLFKNEYKSLILNLSKKHGVHFNNASSHSVTSKIKDQWAYSKSPGYVDLLSINVDHFEDDARISYAIGHSLAMEEAKKAYELKAKGEQEEAVAILNMAYAMDAFASHFLTDLFSSGHLRTPRGGLLEVSNSIKYRTMGYTASNVGLMANAMHDEDGYSGLWLKNKEGQIWNAFGDGSYFDVKSLDNRQAIREALQASVNEVYRTFETAQITPFKKFKALKLVGDPLPSSSDVISKIANPFALFKMTKTWPEVRKNYYDNSIGEYQAITSLTGISSFIKSDLGTFNHANFYSFLMAAHLVESFKRNVIVECYNTFDRESIWPSKEKDYVTLKDSKSMIAIDNKTLQFYSSILIGNLRPDGIFYTVSADEGEKIISQCQHAMETNAKLGLVNGPQVVEIRGRIDRGYSHPIVVFDKEGQLVRLKGYKSETVKN